MTARLALFLAGGTLLGLGSLATLVIASTAGRQEAILYGVFPLALSLVMFAMARRKESPA